MGLRRLFLFGCGPGLIPSPVPFLPAREKQPEPAADSGNDRRPAFAGFCGNSILLTRRLFTSRRHWFIIGGPALILP